TSAPLSLPVSLAGERLWVSAVIAAAPTDSATIDLRLPVGGLTNVSANDGPLDAAVDLGPTLTISNAPLISSVRIDPGESVVGQSLTVRLAVRNRSAEVVTGIAPSAPDVSGGGALTLRSGPSPPAFDLVPAASDTVTWTCEAVGAGAVVVSGRAAGRGATSGASRGSALAASDPHVVYAPTAGIDVSAAQAMPLAVAWGQQGVAPLSLTFMHP